MWYRRNTVWMAFLTAGCLTLGAGCGGDEEDDAKQMNIYTPQGQVVMRYIDLVEGTGPPAKKQDAILVHYTGWVGTEKFDSSRDRGKAYPVVIGDPDLIKGWEGIVGMKKGGKRKLFIPATLGYGEKGRPGTPIKPGSKLIFEIELLEIK